MAKKHRKAIGKFQSDAFTNQMKTLLANIRFASIDTPTKMIVITSSVMDEGKSTCASNLSCAMASSGKRTLLVDADLRRRSLGTMLGLHNENGIYNLLTGGCTLSEAVSATPIPNLYFMDCETNVANPADIFATKRFAILAEKLKETFDYVIFDMPPIGLFVDAAVASNLADGTILVVRQDQTKRDMVEKAIAQLKAADAEILGIVMTFTEETRNDYYYYYYNSEGTRTKKSRHHGESAADLAEEANPESIVVTLEETKISDWEKEFEEKDVRIDAADSPRRVAHSSHARSASAARPAAAQADPFAPGAFKGQGSTGSASSRARGRHHRV